MYIKLTNKNEMETNFILLWLKKKNVNQIAYKPSSLPPPPSLVHMSAQLNLLFEAPLPELTALLSAKCILFHQMS